MRIFFAGAARTVTGTQHLLEFDGTRLLLDCGLYQGRRQESNERNRHLPYDPRQVTRMILSHAHIDHSGNIPTLVKQGFAGHILCTPATRDLCSVMLRDAAHIQEADADFMNRKHRDRLEEPVVPLYTEADSLNALTRFRTLDYHRPAEVLPGVTLTFLDAGHVLGSAIVQLDIQRASDRLRLAFSGDLGRRNMAILRDPEIPESPEVLLLESTYGDRLHAPMAGMETQLAGVVNRAVARKGKILVPSFSLERTQEFVYALHRLTLRKAVPPIPIYVDSPLSVRITEVFTLHPECFDEETLAFMRQRGDPFGFDNLTYISSSDDSKALNDREGPMMIIAAAGMCEAGRILHHLRNGVEDARNTILIIGYQARNTLGRRIAERQPVVRIFGMEHPLEAEVVVMDAFSAHADRDDLLEFVGRCRPSLRKILLVHGEEEQMGPLAERLTGMGIADVQVPMLGEFVRL
ncbi:MAG TPA: MBL fold metallo-hydrolase [Candidatus Methylomirabilis sp.]|nr:MBL fold metallo-hydrolase [Candidatus Methylomirabilis sp.]HSC71156.1 MBL fold metallo-hydrolase [Candidatus Methylomirabilis sp.]